MRPSPEAVALAKAIPDTNDAIWKWSLKMDGSVSLESDPTPVHAAIRILAAECDALEKERDEWATKAAQYAAERESNAMHALAYKAERDDAIADATNAVNDIIRVRYQRDALLDALESMACQHKCGCGHPHCNRCADDRMCEEAIAAAKGGAK